MNVDPFWRTSIGFDRLFDLMDESLRFEPEDHYPPCNIVRTGENTYRISLAVAGFKPEQINVTVNQNMLIVSATADDKQDKGEYLYRGIAGRSFERRFNLADYVVIKGASLDDGLLQIELERELPEAMKPRRIEIQTGTALGKADSPHHRAFQNRVNATSASMSVGWFASSADHLPRCGGIAMEDRSKELTEPCHRATASIRLV